MSRKGFSTRSFNLIACWKASHIPAFRKPLMTILQPSILDIRREIDRILEVQVDEEELSVSLRETCCNKYLFVVVDS